ncbi:MAG: cytochrome c [Actinomycetota bacterium]|nr:cytochrome c [Actinomycetota bacterium]
MDSITSTSRASAVPRRRRLPSKLRRRLVGALMLAIGLFATGALYLVLAPRPQVATAETATQTDPAQIAHGEQLYNNACITCHGTNLQGVQGRGPSLIGVGAAAVYFQVSTGRMPQAREQAEGLRKAPVPELDPNTDEGRQNLQALAAYVQAHGGGPQLPAERGTALIGDDPAKGADAFRLNCASCHSFVGRGGVLTRGKYAPILNQATPEQIYAAMLTGPSAMPTFSDRSITQGEKKDIIAYLLSVRGQRNSPGGYNLGDIGPSAEGMTAFVFGMVALVGITVWLGAKS